MAVYTDSATARVSIAPSGVDVHVNVDSAAVYFDITPGGTEVHGRYDVTGEGQAFNRFTTWEAFLRFESEANARFEGVLRANA